MHNAKIKLIIVASIGFLFSTCSNSEQKSANRKRQADSIENVINSTLAVRLPKGADSRLFKSEYKEAKFVKVDGSEKAVFICTLLITNQTKLRINSATCSGFVNISFDEFEKGVERKKIRFKSTCSGSLMKTDSINLWLPLTDRMIEFRSEPIDLALFRHTPKEVYFEFAHDFKGGESELEETSPYDLGLRQCWEDFQKVLK
jgi:hypothetical protein